MKSPSAEKQRTDLRSEILEAALLCFCESGYDRARMEDVATKSGVSKGTLYLYFKNKEDLFNSICQVIGEQLSLQVAEIFNERRSGGEPSTFREWVQRAESKSEAVSLEMLAESLRNPTLRRILQSQRKAAISVITDSLRRLAKEGAIDSETDFEALSIGLIALYGGLAIEVALGTPEPLIKRAWHETTVRLVQGMTPVRGSEQSEP